MRRAPWKYLCLAAFLFGCQQVDYIEMTPQEVVLKQRNNVVWVQAHPMSHTGVYYSRAHVKWSVKDPAVARVDEVGKVSPLKSGETEVVAAAAGVTAAVPVSVVYVEKIAVEPPRLALKDGQSPVEMHVKAYDYLGRELKDRTPIFHSANQEVLSMGQNAAFPVAPGKTQLEVSVDDVKQTLEVVVEPTRGSARK
jgi:adhesin/invasin